MLIPDVSSSESYIHLCDNHTKRQMLDKPIEIRIHDVSAFAVVFDARGCYQMVPIAYCPYCGQHLQMDTPVDVTDVTKPLH